ncbi:glycosyltransferase family 4 protein [Brachybacterium sillae]|uniref:glycosyltransferase family 4 protein n=1 Tax=Brachybacterium sillae TaxID=2810536 RepID=UPI00217EA07F|nr:glycosyltransferase [Brachybacterium sillae]
MAGVRYALTENQLAALRQLNASLGPADVVVFTTALQAAIYHWALDGAPRRVRTVLQVHGDYRTHNELWNLVLEARDSIDVVQTVAEGLKGQFIPIFGASNVVCVPNIHHPSSIVRAPHEGVEVVLPASFQHRKNQLDALRALARVEDPSVRLSLWGNISHLNPYFIAVQEQIQKLGLQDRVRIPGFGTEQDVYSRADIVLMTSLSEGFGYPLLEAAYHSLPTLTYDYDFGPQDVVEDGASGFVVPIGDVDGLAARLRELAADPGLRERLGRRAREVFDERFSPEAVVAQYRELFGAPAGRSSALADLFPVSGGEPVPLESISHRITGPRGRRLHRITVRGEVPLHAVRIDNGERTAEPKVRRDASHTVIEFPVGSADIVSYGAEPGDTDRHYLAGPAQGTAMPVLPRLRRDANYDMGTPPVEDTIHATSGGAAHVGLSTTPKALVGFAGEAVGAVVWKAQQVLPAMRPTRSAASSESVPVPSEGGTSVADTPALPGIDGPATDPAVDAAMPGTVEPASATASQTATPQEGRVDTTSPVIAIRNLGRAAGLPAQALRTIGTVSRTYANTAGKLLVRSVAVRPAAPTRRELPRHPWFPVTSGVDNFGEPINAPGGVEVQEGGTAERPTVRIRGEYDWVDLQDGHARRRVVPPWSYGEMFEAICAAEAKYSLFDRTGPGGVHLWELGRSAAVIQLAEAAGFFGPSPQAAGVVDDVYTGAKTLRKAPRARTVVFDYPRRGQSGYRTAAFVEEDTLFVVQPGGDGYPDVTEDNLVYPMHEFTQWRQQWRQRWSHLRVPEVDARPYEAALSDTLGIRVDLGDHLRNRLAKFLAEREFWTPVFERVQPEEVLIASSHWSAGVVAAAMRSGARVSDIQYALTSRYAPSFWFGQKPHYGATRFYAWSDFWAERTNVYQEHSVVPRQQPELIELAEKSGQSVEWDICIISQPRILRRLLAFVRDLVRERPGLRLVLAPHPAQRATIAQDLAAAGLDEHVVISQDDTLRTMARAEVCVGTFSTSLWEAAALGKPTYVIQVPGYEETLEDIESGLFRLARSPHDLVPFEVPEFRHRIFR